MIGSNVENHKRERIIGDDGKEYILSFDDVIITPDNRLPFFSYPRGSMQSGRLDNVYFLMLGRGVFNMLHSSFAINGGNRLLQKFNSVERVIENAGKLERLKGGVRQGFIQGNADDIFKGLAQQYKAKIHTNGSEMFFQSVKIRVGLHSSIRNAGTPTLHINNAGQLYKIRIMP